MDTLNWEEGKRVLAYVIRKWGSISRKHSREQAQSKEAGTRRRRGPSKNQKEAQAIVLVNHNRRDLRCHSLSGRQRSLYLLVPTVCLIKASAGKHNDYLTKFSAYLHNLAGQILDASPQPIKEFPWDKAKLMVEERLLLLGKNALTSSLVVLLIFSFVYDGLMAVFVSRELVVPLGLFIGILLANFINESCQELFESKVKGGNDMQQLWGIGFFFVALRFIYLKFRIPGWLLFCHIGNGGLMQILWLVKERKQADIIQNKEEVDALQPTRD